MNISFHAKKTYLLIFTSPLKQLMFPKFDMFKSENGMFKYDKRDTFITTIRVHVFNKNMS